MKYQALDLDRYNELKSKFETMGDEDYGDKNYEERLSEAVELFVTGSLMRHEPLLNDNGEYSAFGTACHILAVRFMKQPSNNLRMWNGKAAPLTKVWASTFPFPFWSVEDADSDADVRAMNLAKQVVRLVRTGQPVTHAMATIAASNATGISSVSKAYYAHKDLAEFTVEAEETLQRSEAEFRKNKDLQNPVSEKDIDSSSQK